MDGSGPLELGLLAQLRDNDTFEFRRDAGAGFGPRAAAQTPGLEAATPQPAVRRAEAGMGRLDAALARARQSPAPAKRRMAQPMNGPRQRVAGAGATRLPRPADLPLPPQPDGAAMIVAGPTLAEAPFAVAPFATPEAARPQAPSPVPVVARPPLLAIRPVRTVVPAKGPPRLQTRRRAQFRALTASLALATAAIPGHVSLSTAAIGPVAPLLLSGPASAPSFGAAIFVPNAPGVRPSKAMQPSAIRSSVPGQPSAVRLARGPMAAEAEASPLRVALAPAKAMRAPRPAQDAAVRRAGPAAGTPPAAIRAAAFPADALPTPPRLTGWGVSHYVALHHTGGASLAAAERAAARLRADGARQVHLVEVPFEIAATHLRLYREMDTGLAERSIAVISAPLGLEPGLRNFTDFAPSPAPGLVEIWIGPDAT